MIRQIIVHVLIWKNQFKKHMFFKLILSYRIILSLVVNGQCVPKVMLALFMDYVVFHREYELVNGAAIGKKGC